ncbi:MAG: AIR synthase family protein [Fusobacteriaceae bacterium]
MKIGKLTINDLKEIIFKNIRNNRSEVITNPEIGGDCAVITTSGDDVIYLSSDPITGATNSLGKLGININANDIATSGVSPLGVMLTILAPPGTTRESLEEIIKEAQEQCDILNMSILGGHTEITDAVNRIVLSVTAIGIGKKNEIKDRRTVLQGDALIITKGIGIEGTGIIASEKSEELEERFGIEFVQKCKNYLNMTSVVKDGIISNKYAKGMHDVTEGGLLGALWEMCELYKLGCKVDYNKIKISDEVRSLTNYFDIDPLKLISSGTMLISVAAKDSAELLDSLIKEGIEAYEIGFLTDDKSKILEINGEEVKIEEPESDELYKVFQ